VRDHLIQSPRPQVTARLVRCGKMLRLAGSTLAVVASAARGQDILQSGTPQNVLATECGAKMSSLAIASVSGGPVDALRNEWTNLSNDACYIGETRWWSPRFKWVENFAQDLLTGDGLHPTAGNIVPGSSTALGAALNFDANPTLPVRLTTELEARTAFNGFWNAGANVTLRFPRLSVDRRWVELVLSGDYVRAEELAYYGLGPLTLLSHESLYGLSRGRVQGTLTVPLPWGFSVGPTVQGIWPTPRGRSAPGVPSIDSAYTDAEAPGLRGSTTYFVSGAVLDWRWPIGQRLNGYWTDLTAKALDFREIAGTALSFTRLSAAWQNVLSLGQDQQYGQISVTGRYVASFAGDNNRVPFYLQPTLGGADLDNVNILASYHDYRFRAPSAGSVQIDYERYLVDPLGIWIFAGSGEVLTRPSSFAVKELRSTYGLGPTLRLGGASVLRLGVAFGGTEGVRVATTGNTNAAGGNGAASLEANAALRGVF
jgi:hypothetical protein